MDINIHAKEIIRMKELTVEYFAEHTGKTAEQIASDLERDYFLTAKQAVDYGIVDSLLSRS
jgi:ATP-dependent Clp protease protease subunit